MSLIPNDFAKPDLFLVEGDTEDSFIDVTNYTIDDLVNLLDNGQGTFKIACLYESSNLNPIIVNSIEFNINKYGTIKFTVYPIVYIDNIDINEISYNNKIYYYYSQPNL